MRCPECGIVILKSFKECPKCGLELTETSSNSPTSLWYLVPIFFGFLGGLIGYVGVKDDDKEMADMLLALGVIVTIIAVFVVWWAVYALFA